MKKRYFLPLLAASAICPLALRAQGPSSTVQQVGCHVNGTMYDASDDVLTLLLEPEAPVAFFEAPYTYTVTATQGGLPVTVLQSNNHAAADIPYGHPVPLKIPDGKAGNGDILLTITPYGSYTPVTASVTDPGSCAANPLDCVPGMKTLSYSYRSPLLPTELDESIVIPKFNPVIGQTLQSATISVTQNIIFSNLFENTGTAARIRAINTLDGYLLLNAAEVSTLSTATPSATHNIPAAVLVPAQNSWPGDVTTMNGGQSTLQAMNAWLVGSVYSGIDPRTDPRYVTRASAVPPAENPGFDDDMIATLFTEQSAANNVTYTTGDSELASLQGTGDIPGGYQTSSGIAVGGTAGNIVFQTITQAYFNVDMQYTYNETCAVLPVTLKSFGAKQVEDQLVFEWSVADERDVSHYDVEVSSNAREFYKLGTVPAALQDRYELSSSLVPAGRHYFRLKSVDLDGGYAYSRVVDLDIVNNETLVLYPIPASENLYFKIDLPEPVTKIVVSNLAGVPVKTIDFPINNEPKIEVGDLIPGIYLVRISTAGGYNRVKKVVIVKP